MKKTLLLLILALGSHFATAQEITSHKQLTISEISQNQWVIQDKNKDLQANVNPTKITLTRASEPVIIGNEKTVIVEIPVKNISTDHQLIKITTGKPTYPNGKKHSALSKDEQAFLKFLTKQTLHVSASNESLFLIADIYHFQEFYTEKKHRLTQFLTKFDWHLIQLNGSSDLNTNVCIEFDFKQQIFIGQIDDVPFESRLKLNVEENTFYFEPMQFTNTNASTITTEEQKAFVNKFENMTYHFDIAEQTLNFYQENKLVMMFGLVKKEDL